MIYNMGQFFLTENTLYREFMVKDIRPKTIKTCRNIPGCESFYSESFVQEKT